MMTQPILKDRKCPQCESDTYEILSEKDGFKFAKCSKCRLIYVPQVLAENAHVSKQPEKTAKKASAGSPKTVRLERVFKFLNKRLKDNSKVNILDFGCGDGFFLNFAKQHGYNNLYATDINNCAIENAKSVGAKTFCGNLKDWKLPDKSIDFIIMDNVIEHLENTKEALRECNRVLKDKGVIFISTPNIDSFIIKMLGVNHRHFGGAEHLTYFTIPTLRAMCDEAGFKAVSIKTALEEPTIARTLNIILKRNLLDYDLGSNAYKDKQGKAITGEKGGRRGRILTKIIKFFIIPVDLILITATNMFKKGAYIDSFFIKET